MEIWKDIEGYEGLYQVSNKGRIKSLNRIDSRGRKVNEKILSSKPNNKGYLRVHLYKNGKRKPFSVHRLVAIAFIPNPNNLLEVNHKDENKENNTVDNLEWCNRKYNTNYGSRNERASVSNKGKKHKKHKKYKKPKFKKQILCIETGEIFDTSQDVINIMFNGKGYSSHIRANICGQHKSAYRYHFKYIERENY